ncbi:MAG: hypothetical protein QXF12_05250 [Candidatus Aenigmatarchaeota archaeon]
MLLKSFYENNFMKRFLILLLLFNIVSAQDIQIYRIVFDINHDMSVREEIKIVFENPVNETMTLK